MPDPSRPRIQWSNGVSSLRDAPGGEVPPWMRRDERSGWYVAEGSRHAQLREWAAQQGIPEAGPGPDAVRGDAPIPWEPRSHQKEALERWTAAGSRGTVVLPTGAGKSLVALLAIRQGGLGACVIAPTRALVQQWYAQLADTFGAEAVGAFYADEKEVRPVTVTTYHSAFALLEHWGHRFDLLVLDEAHHLADGAKGEARAWHDALRVAPAPRRLGLTATYPDGRDRALRDLVGPVVLWRQVREMTDAELADFALVRRFVALDPAERERYDRLTERYEGWVAARGYRDAHREGSDAWFRAFMAETRRSREARAAHRAYLERERVVSLSAPKLREAERLLGLFPAETAVLFCGSAEAAEQVSRRFSVPMVSADTPASERKATLDRVASGEVRAVASVRVLDEGWDVPGAKLGIVLGDSTRGSPRQFRQRLGRLLRRQGDAVASLFEVVSAGTHEFYASQRRGAGLRRPGDGQLGLGL